MRVPLPRPPFNRENLGAVLGFPVPAPLVMTLNALCEDAPSAEQAYWRVDEALGGFMACETHRYMQTPPELFPIAHTGVDGGHFGYMIHAPELACDDYPIAQFEPMDDEGAFLVGASTFEAIETLLSTAILHSEHLGDSSPLSRAWWPEVSARLALLGIYPDIAKAQRNYEDDRSKPVAPYVPDGWRHIPSSDGAGVLAAAALFHPTHDHSMPDQPETESVVEAVARVAGNFPATALWLLRECYWRNWTTSVDDANMLCRAMMDCYRSLGRPSLAAIVASRASISR